MISKKLTCSATGTIVGTILLDGYSEKEIEEALKEIQSAKEKLGLQMESITKKENYFDERHIEIRMSKKESPDHFKCLAQTAKCNGWE